MKKQHNDEQSKGQSRNENNSKQEELTCRALRPELWPSRNPLSGRSPVPAPPINTNNTYDTWDETIANNSVAYRIESFDIPKLSPVPVPP